MTAITAGPSASALQILKAGGCSPSCLLSQEPGRCNCRCQGAHHGALTASLQPGADRGARRCPADAEA